jgi:hypothetical protein
MQDKKPLNDKLQRHGRWEDYWPNGFAFLLGYYINDVRYGHFVWRNRANSTESTEYYAR